MSEPSDCQDESAAPCVSMDRVERLAHVGLWHWNVDTGALQWSDNVFRLHGAKPSETTALHMLLLDGAPPEDRLRLEDHSAAIVRGETRDPLEYRFIGPSGAIRTLRSSLAVVEKDKRGSRSISGIVQDITDETCARRAASLHAAVARSLGEWESVQRGATGLLGNVCDVLGFELGALWLPVGTRWSRAQSGSVRRCRIQS